jgi:tetratricopeptide (TPR) repeat protein
MGDAYTNRAVVYLRTEEYQKAIEDSTAAIKLNSKDATAYANRAIAFDAIGDAKKAEADRKRAAALEERQEPQ